MSGLYKKIGKIFFVTTYILLLLFLLWQILLGRLVNEFMPLGPIYTDVAKRVESPDHTKTALLIRKNGFDLNFAVKIKEGLRIRTLFRTGDFDPDLSADWKEQIIWSDDSSFLVMTVEEPPYRLHDGSLRVGSKYIWAYDFKDNKKYEGCDDESTMEYYNVNTIIRILNSRSTKDKMDLIKLSD